MRWTRGLAPSQKGLLPRRAPRLRGHRAARGVRRVRESVGLCLCQVCLGVFVSARSCQGLPSARVGAAG